MSTAESVLIFRRYEGILQSFERFCNATAFYFQRTDLAKESEYLLQAERIDRAARQIINMLLVAAESEASEHEADWVALARKLPGQALAEPLDVILPFLDSLKSSAKTESDVIEEAKNGLDEFAALIDEIREFLSSYDSAAEETGN